MPARASLTGSWSGAYRYAHGRETVFNAQIEERLRGPDAVGAHR